MKFYIRYMDSYNFRVLPPTQGDIIRFYNSGIYQDAGSSYINPHYRFSSLFGPENTGATIASPYEFINSKNHFAMGCRYSPSSPLSSLPARNTEWALCGSQLGWTTWDMTNVGTFKDQLVTAYTTSFNRAANKTFYESKFGQGFQDLEYNIVIYWGYPLYQDGSPYEHLVTYECLYLGNDPLYDELIEP